MPASQISVKPICYSIDKREAFHRLKRCPVCLSEMVLIGDSIIGDISTELYRCLREPSHVYAETI